MLSVARQEWDMILVQIFSLCWLVAVSAVLRYMFRIASRTIASAIGEAVLALIF